VCGAGVADDNARISPSSRIIWLRCQSASRGWEALEPVHAGGTTLQETVLFEIFLPSLKKVTLPVELCGMDLRRPLARRRNSEVFSMIVSLTAQTTAGLDFIRRRPRKS
jgi:hypothetical protein